MTKKQRVYESAFDTYTVEKTIGEGGSGVVYLVKNSNGDPFALKCLHPHLSTGQRRKRFKNEIAFLSKVQQPSNIVPMVDSGLSINGADKTPFYVMRLYDGTLRSRMSGTIAVADVMPIFSRVLDGVETAHLLGAVHRDLKPENILCDKASDTLAVADFGIALFEEEELLTAVETKAADRLANFQYAAPEQRARGGKVDVRTDIYSLGLILNEMFTGAIPEGTGIATIAAVAPQFAYLDELVEQMRQQRQESRPASIAELKKQLIGRGNAFVAQQSLDSETKKVIRQGEPPIFVPITLTGADWDGQILTLSVSHAPPGHWIARFQRPQEGHSSIMGKGPESFIWKGDKAFNQVAENQAQAIVDHFKNYLEMANRGYVRDLQQEADRENTNHRVALQNAVKLAESRARVAKTLKF
jgi:serine/threonine protein kinase